MPTLARLIHHEDNGVLTDSCRAVFYLLPSQNKDESLKVPVTNRDKQSFSDKQSFNDVTDAGMCRRLVELLEHESVRVLALCMLGNIVVNSGSDALTQVCGVCDDQFNGSVF